MANQPININRAKATVHPNTGAIAVDVPLVIKGKRHHIRFSLNLLSVPVKVLNTAEDIKSYLKAAMQIALTENMSIYDGSGKHITSTTLSAALADLIEFKMEESH